MSAAHPFRAYAQQVMSVCGVTPKNTRLAPAMLRKKVLRTDTNRSLSVFICCSHVKHAEALRQVYLLYLLSPSQIPTTDI